MLCIITGSSKLNAHPEQFCKEEQLLKVNEIYKLPIYKFYFKLLNMNYHINSKISHLLTMVQYFCEQN